MRRSEGKAPFFSVVMPVYNGEKYVREAIESLIAQTEPDWELLAVDDASSDSTPAILKKFADENPKVRVLRNPENLNIARSLNKGITQARGEWIVRLDADDFFRPVYLAAIRAHCILMPESDCFLSSWITVVDEKGKKVLDVKLPEAKTIQRMMKFENFLYHPATSFSKAAWEKVGGYPEDQPSLAEDTGMWLKFFQAGFMLHMIRDPLVNYRIHHTNITSVNDARLTEKGPDAKAYRQNREWTISLFLKQRCLRHARREIVCLARRLGYISAKNFSYFFLTYLPPPVVTFFMWELRPRARALRRILLRRDRV